MGQLKDLLVGDFGTGFRGLKNPFDLGYRLPLDGSQLARLATSVDELVSYEEYDRVRKQAMRIHLFPRLNESEDVVLAARLANHDTGKFYNYLVRTLDFLAMPEERSNPTNLNRLVQELANLKAFGLTMTYLASSGDNQFLMQIPSEQLEHLASGASKHNLTFQVDAISPIKSAEYIVLYQLIKNAPADASIHMHENNGYLVLIVQDQGLGVLGQDKKPLPQDRLHEIFGEFSTTRGGLGLQVAKRLAHLRGGYIKVFTKTESNPTIAYSTGNNLSFTPQFELERGTRFILSIPK